MTPMTDSNEITHTASLPLFWSAKPSAEAALKGDTLSGHTAVVVRSKEWSRLTSHARMRLAQRSRRLSEAALLWLLDADRAATVGYGKGHMHWHRLVYAGDLEWLVAVQDVRDGYVITILNENEGRFQTIPPERKRTARLRADHSNSERPVLPVHGATAPAPGVCMAISGLIRSEGQTSRFRAIGRYRFPAGTLIETAREALADAGFTSCLATRLTERSITIDQVLLITLFSRPTKLLIEIEGVRLMNSHDEFLGAHGHVGGGGNSYIAFNPS